MAIGDIYKSMVLDRTKLVGKELKCPREKNFMTPCVARDGDLALTDDGYCVGCGADISQLIEEEKKNIRKD